MLTGKRCVTSEEIEVRKERILKADSSDRLNQTSVLHNETSESLHQKHSEKMRKEERKNILKGVAVTALFCTALCAVFASNCSRENKLSAAAVLCGVAGLTCSIAGYVKNPYRGRQRG